MKVLTGVAVLALMASLGSRAVAADTDALRVQDRIQIEDLMWRYARALDTENAEAYAATYTPDGQFGTGANAPKGREALKKMINDLNNATLTTKRRPSRRGLPCTTWSPTTPLSLSIRITRGLTLTT